MPIPFMREEEVIKEISPNIIFVPLFIITETPIVARKRITSKYDVVVIISIISNIASTSKRANPALLKSESIRLVDVTAGPVRMPLS